MLCIYWKLQHEFAYQSLHLMKAEKAESGSVAGCHSRALKLLCMRNFYITPRQTAGHLKLHKACSMFFPPCSHLQYQPTQPPTTAPHSPFYSCALLTSLPTASSFHKALQTVSYAFVLPSSLPLPPNCFPNPPQLPSASLTSNGEV